MAVFIDDGEGNEWAVALGFFPWKSDDGVEFRNIASSPSGIAPGGGLTTASLRPTVPLKGGFDAGEGSNDAAPFAPVPFHHAEPDASNQQDNPHA